MSNAASLERRVVVVSSVSELARNIKGFELRATEGRLPPFTAGAHITLHVESDIQRQYSLCNDPGDNSKYHIAVLKEPNGRGGSRYLHEVLLPGASISISGPVNHFSLAPQASRYLLIAGGIGITPILAMVRELSRRNVDFRLHYCARSAPHAAFLDVLPGICRPGQLGIHFDGGDPRFGLDVRQALAEPEEGTHLYCCGPIPLMQAVKAAAAAWPKDNVHFESFKSSDGSDRSEGAFDVVLKRQGARLKVPGAKTIVQVMRESGFNVETSCEAGTCGTCKTRYTSGQPIHNDFVLSDQERAEFVMVCCARASGTLELDL